VVVKAYPLMGGAPDDSGVPRFTINGDEHGDLYSSRPASLDDVGGAGMTRHGSEGRCGTWLVGLPFLDWREVRDV